MCLGLCWAGYKTFNDPDFDYRSSCVTLETCLQVFFGPSFYTYAMPVCVHCQGFFSGQQLLISPSGSCPVLQEL